MWLLLPRTGANRTVSAGLRCIIQASKPLIPLGHAGWQVAKSYTEVSGSCAPSGPCPSPDCRVWSLRVKVDPQGESSTADPLA